MVCVSAVTTISVRLVPGKYHSRGSGMFPSSSDSITRAKSRICTSACGIPTRALSISPKKRSLVRTFSIPSRSPVLAGSPWRTKATLRARSNDQVAVLLNRCTAGKAVTLSLSLNRRPTTLAPPASA